MYSQKVMHGSGHTSTITTSGDVHHRVGNNVVGYHVTERLSVPLPSENVQLLAFLHQSDN